MDIIDIRHIYIYGKNGFAEVFKHLAKSENNFI